MDDILMQNHWADLVFVEVFPSRSIYRLCCKLNMFFSLLFPCDAVLFFSKGSTDIKPGTSFNLTAQTFGRASVYLLLVVVLPVIDRWHCIQGRAKGHRLLPTISQGPTLIIHLKINLSIYQSTPSRVLCLLFGDWRCGDADTLITRRFVFVSLVNERIIT